MSVRPLMVITLAFASGIAAAFYLPWVSSAALGPLALLSAAFLTVAAFFLSLRDGGWGLPWPGSSGARGSMASWLMVAGFLFLGLFWGWQDVVQKQSYLLADLETHLMVTGQVVPEPRIYHNRLVCVVEATEVRQGGWRKSVREKVQLSVFLPDGKAWGNTFGTGPGSWEVGLVRPGDLLEVYGQLELPPTARNPGEFDYRRYLFRQGIYTCMGVEADQIRLVGRQAVNPFLNIVLTLKGRSLTAIEGALGEREAGILEAVLFGDQEKLDDQAVDIYKSLGVYHIFAVSGQQMAYVLLMALALAQVLRLRRGARMLLGVLLLLFYMALTGFSPSVTRAGLMAMAGLAAASLGERAEVYTSLAAAALVILIWRPYELLGAGFQLSFLATWGLIYFYPFFDEVLGFLPPWRRYLAITLAAQLAVLWHTVYYFNLISPAALPANLMVLPAIGVVTILGLLVLAASVAWPGLGGLLAMPCGAILEVLTRMLGRLSSVKGAAFSLATPPWWSGIIYLAFIVGLRELWRYRGAWLTSSVRRRLGPGLAVAVLLGLLLLLALPPPSDLQVVFLDVGQGDATYIRTPGGRSILIDGGGQAGVDDEQARSVGKEVVLPYLIRRGVHRLDLVVSTHPDADHIQGLFPVLEHMPVSLVTLPPSRLFGQEYADFLAFLQKEGIPYQEAVRGSEIALDPAIRLTVLHPGPSGVKSGASGNNNSLVLRLEEGESSFLFTGDIEEEAMNDLLESLGPGQLRCTVFKVPHHGSSSGLQPDFLAAADPRLAVIQAGADNNFGHPAPDMLKFWLDRQVPVLRTDRQGAISLRTQGKALQVSAFLPGE